jgi:hypothetical protein
MNDSAKKLEAAVTGAVIALCIATAVLVLLLPSESLVVDLIYQGF